MTKTLNCKECGRELIHIGDDGVVKAKGVVRENILGDAPKAGDIFGLTCRCGFRIIGLSREYLVEGELIIKLD